MRNDFRAFRIDRIANVAPADRTFKPERGKTLTDFYRTMERGGESSDRAAQT
jgi:predicted DNA-binding transcriptional regulator YafY